MRAMILRTLRPALTTLIPPMLEALKDQAPRMLENAMRSPQRRAWRTYAAAALTGTAATVTQDEIPALCNMASEIADEMVRREAERAEAEDDA